MGYVAVFVDAGYLFAQGSRVLTGTKLQRGEMRLNVDGVVRALADVAARASRELSKMAQAEAGNVPAAEREELIRHIQATGFRPKPIDASLLARSSAAIGGEVLSGGQKEYVRTAFLEFLVELQQAATDDR